ncbi:unnamed protein product, partial [Symbiodinium sp. CCMP2456]
VPATSRRCDGLARRWIRRFAEESARSLFSSSSPAARAAMRELHEGGFAIIEDVLDWCSLVKARVEVERLFQPSEEEQNRAPSPTFTSASRGQTRWCEILMSRLEDLGYQALATSVALLRQLPIALNEDGWRDAKGKRQKAVASQSFQACRWFVRGEVILWQDAGSSDSSAVEAQTMLALDPQANAEGDEPCEQACPPERRMMAFLYLNTPAWRPDWGGALRCHLGSVSRDVWGDGGRLVLLREDRSYELLPSSQQQTVLMMRLEGMLVQPEPSVQDQSRTASDLASARREKAVPLAETAESPPRLESPEDRGSCSWFPEDSVAANVGTAQQMSDVSQGEVEKVEMTSREVVSLFETSLPAAFRLD